MSEHQGQKNQSTPGPASGDASGQGAFTGNPPGMGPGQAAAGPYAANGGMPGQPPDAGRGEFPGPGGRGQPGGWAGAHGGDMHPGAMPPGYAYPGANYGPQPVYGMPPQHPYYAAPPPMAGHPGFHTSAGGHPGQGQGPGMSEVMEELANGGSGLSSLGKLLDFDDKDFWKGALVGAAVVLLLTNESVQNTLFRGGAKAKDTVMSGMDKVREKVHQATEKKASAPSEGQEGADE